MDSVLSTLASILLLCCGGLCAVSILVVGVLVLAGQSGLIGDALRGVTGAFTGRGDDVLTGMVDDAGSATPRARKRRSAGSVEDIRAEMDRRFDSQVGGEASGETSTSWLGPTASADSPLPEARAASRQRRRRYTHDDEMDYLDEIDSFIDDTEL
ncbi:MAG: hypothetical protein JW910_09320 [Anaerolineae bacterium]|nr:hypothetical protein [Anaerolineae bacterium]